MIKNKICIYAICKNEKKFVEQWLNSMSEADYIVVLDTGSTDGTYEMLKNDPRVFRCEQKIINPWRFDVARNESMKLIPEDANILFCTDLDELLDKGWADILKENWIEGYHSRCYYKFAWSHTDSGEPARVLDYGKIHNRDWHWVYPVHEGLVLKENNKFIRQDQILQLGYSIFLHHWPDWTKSRSSYLNLLKLRVEENPNDYESKIYLAHEYYFNGQYENAINQTKTIIKKHSEECHNLEKANCYLIMGDSYIALNELGIAMGCYSQAIMIDEYYRDPYFSLGYCLNNLNEYEHAILILEKCLEKTKRYYSWLERDRAWAEGVYDLLGVAYYWVGRYEDSYWATSEALKFDPNNERLKENLNYAKEKLELK